MDRLSPRTPPGPWRGRPPRSYWPLVAVALAAVFVAGPRWSLSIRVAFVTISVVVLWAAARFLDAIAVGRPPWARQRAEPAPRATPHWALALPGIGGYLTTVAVVLAERAIPSLTDRETVMYLAAFLLPLFLAGSIFGLVAALGRAGRFRTLAVIANGAYILAAALFLLIALSPKY